MTVLADRKDFPILDQQINGHPLIYLDNAATTQKPQQVMAAIDHYYRTTNANVHRGVHELSERATEAYEKARITVQKFINAKSVDEIVFVRGTTEAVNLVASSYGRQNVQQGDEIIISMLEHHSNIVPWQILAEQTGAKLKFIPVNQNGELNLEVYKSIISNKTKIVAVNHVSNAIGTINPVKEIIDIAHQHNVPVILDGAQAVPHLPVDVQDLDCDFYAFSSHKVYGPTGMGVLYGKHELLEKMPPYQAGGEMITMVTVEKATYSKVPHKFEAGTPNIAGAIGLQTAIEYVQSFGYEKIHDYEQQLLSYATEQLQQISGLTIIGTAKEKVPVISFTLDHAHPHDIGTILNSEGVAIRAGHHCTMPLMDHLGVPGTARASFAVYNTMEDVDSLVKAIEKVKQVMG